MSRVITFSRFFPAYHPRKGEPTFFVEQILNGISEKTEGNGLVDRDKLKDEVLLIVNDFFLLCSKDQIKHHTIRAGKRWKVGDKFTPRVWGTDVNPKSGRSGPYQSKQITIAPDIEIKKTWDFGMDENGFYTLNNSVAFDVHNVAENDGLSKHDFDFWFRQKKGWSFNGQIICWNKNIEY